MKWWEKAIIIVTLLYVTPLVLWPWVAPVGYSQFLQGPSGLQSYLVMFWAGVTLALASVIATFVDLHKRQFKDRRTKTIWLIVLLFAGTPGWLIYLWIHGFRPRPSPGVLSGEAG